MTFSSNPISSTGQQVTVSYTVNGVRYCSVIASPNANCSYQTPASPQNVTVLIMAKDATGAVASATMTMVISSNTATAPATVTATPALSLAPAAFALSSPANGSTASGTIQVTGTTGSQWLNIAAFNTVNGVIDFSTKLSPDVMPINGAFSLPINTALIANALDTIAIVVFSVPAGQSGGTAAALNLALNVNNSTPTQTPSLTQTAPARTGFTIKTAEYFTSIDPMKWMVQEANSPAAINLSSNPADAFGEVEANLPNQYVMLPGGGVRIVSKKQSFSTIGGNANRQCADSSVSFCSFPWTSAQFSGKGGLQSGYGYYEWATKLPEVPAGGLGTWPATWLLGGDTAPQYEEIDFMERFSTDPDHIDFHLHYGSGTGDFNNSNSIHFCDTADTTGHHWTDLHTFAVDWEPTSITGYIDGVQCGVVRQGDAPNEYGSTPAIIPSGLMFPIFNTAISPNANAATAANPVYFDVFHYLFYSSNANPTATPVAHLTGLTVDRAVYNPGDTVSVRYTIAAGDAALTGVSLSGVAVMDFLGDSSSFQQGSTINGVFGDWMYFPLSNTINANSSYTGTFTYAIASTMTPGLYTVYVGTLNANGVAYPGNYIRFAVGIGTIPPAP